MQAVNWAILENKVSAWVREAGEKIKKSFAAPTPLEVSSKSAYNDLVTNMDRSIEQFLVEKIRTNYPGQSIISEEGFGDKTDTVNGILWFVDPIDGTLNFVKQQRFFAISIAVYENGKGKAAFIYDVMADEFFHCLAGQGAYLNSEKLKPIKDCVLKDAMLDLSMSWLKPNKRIDENVLTDVIQTCSGTRSYGAASIELAYVAAGFLNAYFTMRLSPWDYAAGLILIHEVGGIATRVDGRPIDLLTKQTSLLVAGPTLHGEITHRIRVKINEGKNVNEPDSVS